MKTTIYTIIIALVLVYAAIFATLWSEKKQQTKAGIQQIGYKAVLNDSVLIDSIIQDTTDFKKVFPYAKMKFIVVTKKF